jgi:shikimate dehydrogenase
MTKQFAVIGSPISQSKSPIIHRAAHRVLGLDWSYSAVEISEGRLLQFLETLDDSWQGLSVTMPLKLEASRLASELDPVAQATGVTNTLLRTQDGWKGFNTDVFGIQTALKDSFASEAPLVLILGSGATATSAAFAAFQSNPQARVMLIGRNQITAKQTKSLAAKSGFSIEIRSFKALHRSLATADIVISTLPAGALDTYATKLGKHWFYKPKGVFFDVAYNSWPSAFAAAWMARSLPAVNGLEMLIFQAIGQLRVFTSGTAETPLPNERAVELAMRDSLGLI